MKTKIQTLAKILWAFTRKYLLAPLPAILIIAGAAVLIILGAKNIQIGGLLGKLFGHNSPDSKKDEANTIPEGRKDPSGALIPIGTPDAKGDTQAVVGDLETPGVFSDQTKVVIKNGDEKVVVDLPTGVNAKDVDKVIVVSPTVTTTTVTDSSKVPAKKIDDLLNKFGG